MGFLRNGLAAAGAALALAAPPAAAATMKAVYEGTVSQGYDQDGSWGNGAGFNVLDGLSVLVEVLFDPTLGSRTTGTFGGSDVDVVYGGTSNAAPDFISSIQITINNITRSVGFASYQHAQVVDDNSTFSQHYLMAYDVFYDGNGGYDGFSYFQGSANDLSGVIPVDLEAPFTWDALSTSYISTGYFEFYDHYDATNGHTNLSYGSIQFSKLTVSRVGGPSPVPLPASALLLLGAGGGLMLLGRRRRAA